MRVLFYVRDTTSWPSGLRQGSTEKGERSCVMNIAGIFMLHLSIQILMQLWLGEYTRICRQVLSTTSQQPRCFSTFPPPARPFVSTNDDSYVCAPMILDALFCYEKRRHGRGTLAILSVIVSVHYAEGGRNSSWSITDLEWIRSVWHMGTLCFLSPRT